jgi:hypothetical protein
MASCWSLVSPASQRQDISRQNLPEFPAREFRKLPQSNAANCQNPQSVRSTGSAFRVDVPLFKQSGQPRR